MIRKFVDLLFFLILFSYGLISLWRFSEERSVLNYPGILLLGIFFIFVAYVLRLLRLYLLMLEKKSEFRELVAIFIKTSFVGWILPFKLGEIYRICRYGYYLDTGKAGIMVIWIERFFDSVVILLLLLATFLKWTMYFRLFFLITTFVLLSFFVYYALPVSYKYTKRILLTKSGTQKGLVYLKIIEGLIEFYNEARELIRGRGTMLLTISAILWFCEILTFVVLSSGLNMNISIADFINYLNDLLSLGNKSQLNKLGLWYGITSLTLLLSGLCFALGNDMLKLMKRG